jgi:DNA-binding transcriptional LysR family regulator
MTIRGGTRYLDTFVAAVESGSFLKAAETLHVTPSTVSYQIKQLETWLDAPLFERTGRRVLPTALGERLHVVCGRFMGELAALRSAVHRQSGPERAVLRIATGSSFGRYVLTPLLARDAFRHAAVDLRFGTDDEVWAAVANGRADVGFAYTAGASNSLAYQQVYNYSLLLIGPPGRTRAGDIQSWIAENEFITYDDCESTFARWFETNLGGMPSRLRTTGHCTEIEETVALVAAGRGLSIVPGHTLHAALKARQIRSISVPGKPATEDTVYHVSRIGSFQDRVAGELLAALAAFAT